MCSHRGTVLYGSVRYWSRSLLLWAFLAAAYLTKRQVRKRTAEVAAQIAAQEERQRIAADVHDELGADLSHLLMLTRQTAAQKDLDAGSREMLTTVEAHAIGIVHKIDEIIWSLDPQDDDRLRTLAFIQRSVEEMTGRHGLAFRTAPIVGHGVVPIGSAERRELYLLVKELATNILKHANCTTLHFEAELHPSRVEITLLHNGTPLQDNGHGNGHGLQNIRVRARRLHAEVLTTNTPDGQVRTRVLVPVQDPTEMMDRPTA